MKFVMSRDAREELEVLVEPTLEEITHEIADDMRLHCPVGEGELLASIHDEGTRITIGTDHWAEVEYGTSQFREPGAPEPHGTKRPITGGMAAQPFIRPALYKKRTTE